MYDDYGIEVEVRGEIGDGYRLKVSATSIGMYIDGFRALKSIKNASGYWIQPPAQQIKGKWVHTPEFNTKTEFWSQLENKCVESITEYELHVDNEEEDELRDELDELVDLKDIPL